MRTILEQARTSYDVTIIDTPPVLAVADVLGLASLVDGLIMVVAVAETSEAQVADAADQIRASGGTLLGVVLNRSGSTAPQYYDQYRRPATSPERRVCRRSAVEPDPKPGESVSLGCSR